MRDSVVFYRSFYEAIKRLPEKEQAESFRAIMEYALNDKEPEEDGVAMAIYLMAKPQIDANNKRYQNGTKGGRTITKEKPSNNQTITKHEPNVNVNENDNVNVNNKYSCAFEQFWDAYPRKKEKARAYKCYLARLKDGFSEDELLLAVKRYADECRCNETEEKYIKLASTFIGPNTPFSDYLRSDYRPLKAPKKSNSFNNFQGRDYDMSDLECRLIQ